MIELRFVKREISVPTGQPNIAKRIEVKILQQRGAFDLNAKPWPEWTDVPLVEPEDEDKDD
jgi:hypothetical protein